MANSSTPEKPSLKPGEFFVKGVGVVKVLPNGRGEIVKPTDRLCFNCKSPLKGKYKSKFCSPKCNGEYMTGKLRVERREVICATCKQSFDVPVTDERKYCSPECSQKATPARHDAARVDRPCSQCGTVLRLPKWEAEPENVFCDNKCFALFMSKAQNARPRGAGGGKRDDLGLYLRSRWEANYCRYLNWLVANKVISKWEYEPDTFEFEGIKRGNRFYTPDFKVWELDGSYCYHEVKGWMDEQSATKLNRMSKYHPSVKILVIGGDEYRSIAKQMKNVLPNWE